MSREDMDMESIKLLRPDGRRGRVSLVEGSLDRVWLTDGCLESGWLVLTTVDGLREPTGVMLAGVAGPSCP